MAGLTPSPNFCEIRFPREKALLYERRHSLANNNIESPGAPLLARQATAMLTCDPISPFPPPTKKPRHPAGSISERPLSDAFCNGVISQAACPDMPTRLPPAEPLQE